ncbi:MAG: hypothetical protein E6P95_01755 [Candidatus Moraniibacteriota bacterium]|nr:MAG: hypothetical protein E6P95_01755 [Candidatus Moranbacteria bacterium]
MAEGAKPKISIFHDEFDAEAENLFHDFQKTENLDLLLKSAETYLKSKNPEKEQIHHILKSLYYRKRGIAEKDDAKALIEFEVSREHLLKVEDEQSEGVKTLQLEVLGRKLKLSNKDKKQMRQLFLESAQLNKELGKEKEYHSLMALHHMYGTFEYEVLDDRTLKEAELMAKEGELSGQEELAYKTKALLHQIKAKTVLGPKESLEELEMALAATEMTQDKYGKEETEAQILYAKGMMTVGRNKRNELFREAGAKWLAAGNQAEVMNVAKMLAPLPVNIMAMLEMADIVIEKQNEMLASVRKMTKKPEGAYMLFYHHSYLLERLKDFKKIITRLGKSRKRLTELGILRSKHEPKTFRRKLSKKLQTIAQEHDSLTQSMRLDLESLYIFGKILLDQWSFTIGYLLGLKNPELFDFHRLYDVIAGNKDKGLLQPVWDKHRKDIFWLYYQLKAYRNEFIEHVKRPWQKGTTMSVYGDEFNLFIPTPPGYFTDEEVEKKLKSVRHLMPKVLKDMPDDYWEKKRLKRTLEVTFYRIDEIVEKEDREKVWKVWCDIGGSTPSYDKIAARLINFVFSSTDTIRAIVEENSQNVDLGETKKEQEQE